MRQVLKELLRYQSAVAGLVIIGFFVILSVYAVIAVPYPEAIRLWRGGEDLWQHNPRNARPEWINWFLREDLPRTVA
ncbi:MAG: ABC transporter permease, partial [Armatimonadota bacterium]|nr:ABC transporter permease [Armatimonadota bacterium]